jgi:hypothetical protein
MFNPEGKFQRPKLHIRHHAGHHRQIAVNCDRLPQADAETVGIHIDKIDLVSRSRNKLIIKVIDLRGFDAGKNHRNRYRSGFPEHG